MFDCCFSLTWKFTQLKQNESFTARLKIVQYQHVRATITRTIKAWSLTKNERIHQACLETTPQKANFMRTNTTKAPYLGNLASTALCAKAIWPLYLSPEAAHSEGLYAGVLDVWSGGGRRCVQMETGAKRFGGRAVLTTDWKLDPGLTLPKQSPPRAQPRSFDMDTCWRDLGGKIKTSSSVFFLKRFKEWKKDNKQTKVCML